MDNSNELTIEELIGIVTQDGRSISTLKDDKSNVRDFLKEYGIKDGASLIPNYLVYYVYCKNWNPTGKKLSKIGFLRKLSVVFESKRSNNTRYYLLDQEVFDLSEESLNDAKQFDRRYRSKVTKKIKKKQGEIPSSQETIQFEDETGLY